MIPKPGALVLGGVVTMMLCGCSQFNMTPPCDETRLGLMRQLAVPAATRPDPVRLEAIMAISRFEELDSSYNARICKAEVVARASRATVTYGITQSEGVQGWYVIELQNASSPNVQMLIQEVRSAYAGF